MHIAVGVVIHDYSIRSILSGVSVYDHSLNGPSWVLQHGQSDASVAVSRCGSNGLVDISNYSCIAVVIRGHINHMRSARNRVNRPAAVRSEL